MSAHDEHGPFELAEAELDALRAEVKRLERFERWFVDQEADVVRLREALRTLLEDIRKHAHGSAAPGHLDHIREAQAALAATDPKP